MSSKFIFYGKKIAVGWAIAIFGGIAAHYSIQHQLSDDGRTGKWVNNQLPTNDSDDQKRLRLQQESWISSLFYDIPEEKQIQIMKRWQGSGAQQPKSDPTVEKGIYDFHKETRDTYLKNTNGGLVKKKEKE
jgi:hypothetical protein